MVEVTANFAVDRRMFSDLIVAYAIKLYSEMACSIQKLSLLQYMCVITLFFMDHFHGNIIPAFRMPRLS